MFSNLTASYDPVFWPIHVNIDRLWWEWQKINPNGQPSDLDSILSPWSYTIRDTLDVSRFGYEYVRGSWLMLVGLRAPIGRFISVPIRISEPIRNFRKAEIRLHWVPQLYGRACARISQPAGRQRRDALDGQSEFRRLPGDLRPRRMLWWTRSLRPPVTPRAQFRHPRTQSQHTAQSPHRRDRRGEPVIGQRADVQITLVVIGADYREEKELLKLEGVSLNFLD